MTAQKRKGLISPAMVVVVVVVVVVTVVMAVVAVPVVGTVVVGIPQTAPVVAAAVASVR